MASVKWLERIRVIPDAFSGAFQTHSYVYHWPDGTSHSVTTMQVRALVTDPLPGQTLARAKHTIRGWGASSPACAAGCANFCAWKSKMGQATTPNTAVPSG